MADLSSDELDLLADYTADVLGPAEAARVEWLLRTDARWAAAHRALIGADARVRAVLAAQRSPGMPADVAARVDAALVRERRGGLVGVPGGARVGASRGAVQRRRRVFLGVAAAAAAVAAIAGGVSVAGQFAHSRVATSAQDAAAGGRGAPASAPSPAGAPRTLSSGTDYDRDTLAALARSAAAAPDLAMEGSKAQASAAPAAPAAPTPTPARGDQGPLVTSEALSRLSAPAALAACLQAIQAAHPGTVAAIDFAQFEHQPALIVLIRQGTTSFVVAVGPNCGIAGADEKAYVTA